MDLDRHRRILKIRLRLPDLGLHWIIRRVSFSGPGAVMSSSRPVPAGRTVVIQNGGGTLNRMLKQPPSLAKCHG